MTHRALAGLALALLLSAIAAPAHAADRAEAPQSPPWQLPMLAAGAGLALGMLVGRRGAGVARWGMRRQEPIARPPAASLHPGIDAPTERRPRPGERRAQGNCQLIVYSAERRTAHELRGRQCLIGRDPGCDIVVDEPQVAALHARVTLGVGEVTVTDLASASGTSLMPGGPALTPHRPATIYDGDEFWIGPEIRVTLHLSGQA